MNEAVAVEDAPVQPAAPKMDDKIQGLEVTYQQVKDLGWSDQLVQAMQDAKKQYPNIHVIECASQWYVIRALNRREYRTLVQNHASTAQEEISKGDGASPQAIQATLNMINEETVAVQGTVYPPMNQDVIRSREAGLATTLHDSILMVSGYQNQPAPIKI